MPPALAFAWIDLWWSAMFNADKSNSGLPCGLMRKSDPHRSSSLSPPNHDVSVPSLACNYSGVVIWESLRLHSSSTGTVALSMDVVRHIPKTPELSAVGALAARKPFTHHCTALDVELGSTTMWLGDSDTHGRPRLGSRLLISPWRSSGVAAIWKIHQWMKDSLTLSYIKINLTEKHLHLYLDESV